MTSPTVSSPATIEQTSCAFCQTGQRAENLLFSTPDFWYGVNGEFSVYRCHQCGLHFQFPYPTAEQIDSFYPSDYVPYQTAIEDEPSWLQRLNRRYARAKWVRFVTHQTQKPGRVLDVGCATGIFLDGLQQVGWSAAGIELNGEASSYARERFDLRVHTGTLENAPFDPQSFDLLTMWNVLEHLPDPLGALQMLNRLATSNGQLMFSLPNPDGIETRIFGRFWAGWDQPRHLFIMPEPVLKQMLAQSGWAFKEKFTFGGRFFLLKLSMNHWFDNRVSNPALAKILKTVFGSPVFKVITLPWFAITEWLKLGSIMVIVANKRTTNEVLN